MTTVRKQTVDYKLKLDPELHRWLKIHAAENYRTLSSEIIMHLDRAYKTIEGNGNKNVKA